MAWSSNHLGGKLLKILKNMFKLLKILQMLKLFKIIKLFKFIDILRLLKMPNLLRRQSAAEPLVPLLVRPLVPVLTVYGNFAPWIESNGKQTTCPE